MLRVGATWLVAGMALGTVRGAETPGDWMAQAARAIRAERWEEAEKAIARGREMAPEDASSYLWEARLQLAQGRSGPAVKALDQVLERDPGLDQAYQLRGSEHFKLGHIKESIRDFDAYLERRPAEEPYHWQRGISYYYAEEYEKGRKQFELHQTVNAHDVENAVWHFLCVARVSGLEEARARLIPIVGDGRVPMKEVHALFAGKGTVEEVMAAARAGEVSEEIRRHRLFYAHLYLGLYHEATGDLRVRDKEIRAAAALADPGNYMGNVALVHARRLKGDSAL